MLKSLIYFWRSHLAVLLGAAVAGSVLTGALLVGDSVRGSLRQLALDRLGQIDDALVATHLFRQQLADDLAAEPDFQAAYHAAAPALLLNASAVHADSQARASGIDVYGVEAGFSSFFGEQWDFSRAAGELFPAVILNRSLARELGAKEGDSLLLSFQHLSDVHPETLLGDRDPEDVVERLRLTVRRILPDQGVGRFGLRPNQNLPRNAFVSLELLQERLDQLGRVNALFLSRREGSDDLAPEALARALKNTVQLEDYGLRLLGRPGYLSLESRQFVLNPRIADAVSQTAAESGIPQQPILTYLANRIEVGSRMVPYSTITAVDAGASESDESGQSDPFAGWTLLGGTPAPPLEDGQIYLNVWAAVRLQARPGDTVRITYYQVEEGEKLTTREAEFRLAGVLSMEGLADDPHLTADYPGISDADNMADWMPPFPVELDWIGQDDEDYWDEHRGTPKAFVNLSTGQSLWTSRFGNLTAIRMAAALTPEGARPSGTPAQQLEETAADFSRAFLTRVEPTGFGFSLQPVKERNLQAAAGSTDFSGLFIGFSLFLIISSALLVGLLFRLGAEQRGREVGTLLALGFPVSKVRRRFLVEGGLVAVLGGLLGLAGAAGYAWLMMAGLRTWWVAAVGTPFLQLHLEQQSLIIGYALSLVVVLISIFLAVRKLSKLPAPALLAGVTSIYEEKGPSPLSRWTFRIALLLALALFVAGFFVEGSEAAGIFFGAGACFLTAGLAFFAVWCRRDYRGKVLGAEGNEKIQFPLALRNTSRNPGRSLLSAALVASACFVIVSVGAFQQHFGADILSKDSGAGGFPLLARSDIPVHRDLNDEEVRVDSGLAGLPPQAHLYPFRVLPGEDASCLNLYKPEKPRVLGVPQQLIDRGGFSFASLSEERQNPWTLLQDDLGPGVIPAFADANSSQWILKVPLGGDVELTNESGETVKLRLVGLLQTSIFQSELLIAEDRFIENFPSRDGYSYFLIETPPTAASEVSETLESGLSGYGFDASSTAQKLDDYHAVQNTYLSTFQSLGGLGLLLGTLGLGVILARNVNERRSELATLRAFGFSQALLARVVLTENAFLLSLGMLLGAVSAFLAVLPHLFSQSTHLPWLSLLLTLVLIFAVGLLSGTAAVRTALRTPLLPALKEER